MDEKISGKTGKKRNERIDKKSGRETNRKTKGKIL